MTADATADATARGAASASHTPPELLPPRAPWVPASDERALSACALTELRRSSALPAFYEGACGGARVLWLPATAARPTRHRAQLALYRLARVAGVDVVPVTAARSDARAALLSMLPPTELATLSDDPAGRIASAIMRLPDGEVIKARNSVEAARWARPARQGDARSTADARSADDWQRVLALDYVTANLFRDAVLVGPDGRLWMVDGSTAFYEHPSPGAADQLFDQLKRTRRPAPGLADALARLTRAAIDDALRAGSYEEWLVHHRAVGEIALRARAAHGWALATAGGGD